MVKNPTNTANGLVRVVASKHARCQTEGLTIFQRLLQYGAVGMDFGDGSQAIRKTILGIATNDARPKIK